MKIYRLALDVGAESIGWAAIELHPTTLEPAGILRLGVRVYEDGRHPKTSTSLAAGRRVARQARRRRDRFLQRQARLMTALVALGLMPADRDQRKALESEDPYTLRRDALERPLPPHLLGRALFHINQRRGFRSSRHAGAEEETEKGKIAAGVEALAAAIQADGQPTLGAWLAWRRGRPNPKERTVRARLEGAGAKARYPFYPSRALLDAEFQAIRAVQAAHHPDLSAEDWDRLHGIVFHQRPLRPVKAGRCTFYPDEERCPWAYPLAQRFRIAQEVANLRIRSRDGYPRRLSDEQRRLVREQLARKDSVPFKKIHALLGLAPAEALNLESDSRSELAGDETAALLAQKKRFGLLWFGLTDAERDLVIDRLLAFETEAEETDLRAWLADRFGLSAAQAVAVTTTHLPDRHCRLGRTALAAVVPVMEERGIGYAEAADVAGLHHSDLRPHGQGYDKLPLYAEIPAMERFLSFGSGEDTDRDPFRRIGRIANPTIHIGLNQVRTLVNDLIAEYGKPREIFVELARDLSRTAEDRRKVEREQAENKRKNDERRRKLRELGQKETADNVMRLRLWEELPFDGVRRVCVYTGEPIKENRLFGAHSDVDIDHILPYRRTLDDSPANRLVCVRRANRAKRNLSPFEAFGDGRSPDFDWEAIRERVKALPANRRWRFLPDAMSRFDDRQAFLDRHLNDTRYLARLARVYLGSLYDLRAEGERVRAVPGTLVGLLRRTWGLNDLLARDGEKNRNDHRHHAVDAAVIGIIDTRTVQLVQAAAKSAEEQDLDRLLAGMEPRHNWFRDQLHDRLNRIVVSVKPEHGVSGRLHEDTSYGLIRNPAAEDGHTLVYRKAFDQLSAKEIERIRDPHLRQAIAAHVTAEASAGRDLKAALKSFAERTDHPWPGLRHVRLRKREAAFATIRHGAGPTGAPHRRAVVPGENLCVDIVRGADGRWSGRGITLFDAARQAVNGRLPPPGPEVVMRLYKGDLVRLTVSVAGPDGTTTDRPEVMRVHILDLANGRLRLAAHNESGELQKRHDDKDDPFRWTIISFDVMRRRGARKVTVTPSGRLRDPGPAGAG